MLQSQKKRSSDTGSKLEQVIIMRNQQIEKIVETIHASSTSLQYVEKSPSMSQIKPDCEQSQQKAVNEF